MRLFFSHIFAQLFCQWNQLSVVFSLHHNPAVTASPCHLPFHKGGFDAVQNHTPDNTLKGNSSTHLNPFGKFKFS